MNRTVVQPHNLDLESPGRRNYWVALEHDTMWGAQLIPLTVFVGSQVVTGRGIVAIGGTHGNEYEGPVAIKSLLGELELDAVIGRIVLIPVLNVEAFRTGTRDSESADGVNLNRAFVAEAGHVSALSGITHRIADFVRQFLWPHVHVVLDLHSGGRQLRFAPCASFHPIDNEPLRTATFATARGFGVPMIMIYQNKTPGLLTSEAERLGKVTVGTELGWGEAVSADGVRYGRQGVLSAAARHGQLVGRFEPIAHEADGSQRCAAIVSERCYLPALYDGHYEEVTPCGAPVEEGELIGRVHNFDRLDEPADLVRAPFHGIVVAQAWHACVRRGQFVACVGLEQSWE
jgi:predicted deacylase